MRSDEAQLGMGEQLGWSTTGGCKDSSSIYASRAANWSMLVSMPPEVVTLKYTTSPRATRSPFASPRRRITVGCKVTSRRRFDAGCVGTPPRAVVTLWYVITFRHTGVSSLSQPRCTKRPAPPLRTPFRPSSTNTQQCLNTNTALIRTTATATAPRFWGPPLATDMSASVETSPCGAMCSRTR